MRFYVSGDWPWRFRLIFERGHWYVSPKVALFGRLFELVIQIRRRRP